MLLDLSSFCEDDSYSVSVKTYVPRVSVGAYRGTFLYLINSITALNPLENYTSAVEAVAHLTGNAPVANIIKTFLPVEKEQRFYCGDTSMYRFNNELSTWVLIQRCDCNCSGVFPENILQIW